MKLARSDLANFVNGVVAKKFDEGKVRQGSTSETSLKILIVGSGKKQI